MAVVAVVAIVAMKSGRSISLRHRRKVEVVAVPWWWWWSRLRPRQQQQQQQLEQQLRRQRLAIAVSLRQFDELGHHFRVDFDETIKGGGASHPGDVRHHRSAPQQSGRGKPATGGTSHRLPPTVTEHGLPSWLMSTATRSGTGV